MVSSLIVTLLVSGRYTQALIRYSRPLAAASLMPVLGGTSLSPTASPAERSSEGTLSTHSDLDVAYVPALPAGLGVMTYEASLVMR